MPKSPREFTLAVHEQLEDGLFRKAELRLIVSDDGSLRVIDIFGEGVEEFR